VRGGYFFRGRRFVAQYRSRRALGFDERTSTVSGEPQFLSRYVETEVLPSLRQKRYKCRTKNKKRRRMPNEYSDKGSDPSRSRSTWKILAALSAPLSALLVLVPVSWSSHANAHVRVNQIGYESSLPMRAFLMATGSESGAKFSVKTSDGETLYSAAIGPGLGAWGSYTVYPLDFTVSAAATYAITVTGPIPATSLSFRVDTPAKLYSIALTNALSFFQNQRDGADYIPSALRPAPAHLNDQKAKVYNTPEFSGHEGSHIKGDLGASGTVIDASGGWWDAGDCLKFVHTTSYAVALMLVGVRDFPNQMGVGSPTSNFMNEAKFGVDWLQRMWDDKSRTLYYQVGIGSGNSGFENDHSIWRLPQADDTYRDTDPRYRYIRNRPVFISGPAGSKISPNLAGRLAGDFALCFRAYQTSSAAYANQCLFEAEHIFALADTSPVGQLLTAAPHDFYGESEWRDDMEFGATELYFATRSGNLPDRLPHSDPMFYLRAAANWASAYIHAENKAADSLNLSDMSGLAHFELYRAIALAEDPSVLPVSQSDLLGDMRKKLDGAAAQAGKDPFGFGYPWGQGDTPAYGAGLSVMASEYGYLTNSNTYANYSTRWLANILGANAWGSSFIVGDGSSFPHCLHHEVANLAGSHNGQPPILAGALVEGPIRKPDSGAPNGALACPPNGEDAFSPFNGNDAVYKDNSKFYSTVEPAIDLTAPSFLMFSWRIAGAPSGPSRPGEFHPGSLTDPDVNLSIHPARAIQRRLPPSIKTRSSSGCPLTPSRCGWPAPFAPRALLRFIALTEQCAPDRCLGTFGLVGSPLVPFPLPSPTRFSSSVRKPGYESCLLYAGHRMASK
jgi:endoglucanase